MVKLFHLIRGILALPRRVGLVVVLVGLGAGAASYGPQIWELGSNALALGQTPGDGTFDPAVLLSPEKELNLINSVEEEVAPQLRRAQILIRKQEAEIGYLREKARFIEARVPRPCGETRTAEEILLDLARKAAGESSEAKEDRELFRRLGGPTWVAMRNRREELATSLQGLLRLNERVASLKSTLEKRRLLTLQYAPKEAEEECQTEEQVRFPEIERTKDLLEVAHETLFKTVYALDPGLLQDEKSNTDGVTLAQTP
jgi:hypothetical protein